jgi:signal transduction histidine kinase
MPTRDEHGHSWWQRFSAHADTSTMPPESVQSADLVWRSWNVVRRFDRRFSLGVDTLIALLLFALFSSSVLVGGPPRFKLLFTAGLTLPLILRRRTPFAVFAVMSGVAFIQWSTSRPLVADAALLVALYSVTVVSDRLSTAVAVITLEMGIVLATIRWAPVGGHLKSVVFLTGMMSAALFAGVVVRTLRDQMDWLAERARRLEYERDQQAFIAAAAERSRIAREMHDVVSHNIQVMVTLADGAAIAQHTNPERAAEAMLEVSGTGRQALVDMRRMLGLLRPREVAPADGDANVGLAVLAPQPGLKDLDALVDRVRSTGLDVLLQASGDPVDLSEAAELTVYRIVQEALTNVLKHASSPQCVQVLVIYQGSDVSVSVTDDGALQSAGVPSVRSPESGGHGLAGMTERAAAFGGSFSAGPVVGGGWNVSVTLPGCHSAVPA